MATIFEPAFSTSTIRPPLSSANAPSMADTLPSINFGFDDLRNRMAQFTTRFDDFIDKGRKRVLEERNQFRINLAELQENQRLKRKELDIVSQKSAAHTQALEKESAETQELHTAITALTTQRNTRASQRDALRAQIKSASKLITQRLAAQQQYAAALDKQARSNKPELDFWMTYLCLRIEGAGREDRLRFVFSHVDERDWEQEVSFELDTERRDYRVVGCRPKLDEERLERCVEKLNGNRDLGGFLKEMRELFRSAIR